MDFELEGAEGYKVMCGHEFLAWEKGISACLCPRSSSLCLSSLPLSLSVSVGIKKALSVMVIVYRAAEED